MVPFAVSYDYFQLQLLLCIFSVLYFYLLQHQLSFPTGLISSQIILSDAYTVGLYSSLRPPTACMVLHQRVAFLSVFSCGFIPLTSSPGCWPVGCQPHMVNYLLSEPWSPPLGPSSITLYQRQPIELPPSPPGCPTTWLITIHAAANPAEPRHQYSCLQNNIN